MIVNMNMIMCFPYRNSHASEHVIWVQFSVKFCLNYGHNCLTGMPAPCFGLSTSVEPVWPFQNAALTQPISSPKIFQWLPIPTAWNLNPLGWHTNFFVISPLLVSLGSSQSPDTSSLHPEWFVILGMCQGLVTLRLFTHQPPPPISYPHAPFITWLTSIHPLGFSPDVTSLQKMFVWPQVSELDSPPPLL